MTQATGWTLRCKEDHHRGCESQGRPELPSPSSRCLLPCALLAADCSAPALTLPTATAGALRVSLIQHFRALSVPGVE